MLLCSGLYKSSSAELGGLKVMDCDMHKVTLLTTTQTEESIR